jgi:predicted nucleic acid-binding protein
MGWRVRVVLDTSVVIGPPPVELDGELAISAVSLAELHFGVLVATDENQRAARLHRLSVLEREFNPLPVDAAVAAAYGRLAAAVTVRGRRPRSRSMDLLIAATAVANDAALATRNRSDLAGIESLVEILAV